jgi:rhodanese-related sulfurtransferase
LFKEESAMDDRSITPAALRQSLEGSQPPLVVDVRRQERFYEAADLIAGALRCDPLRIDTLKKRLPAAANVVVYCVHGHEVSQEAAKTLGARYLEGGIEAWRAAGGDLLGKPARAATRWVTRERPKIDRIACPWLVRRFIDADAEFLYVPGADVLKVAKERGAIPYDVPDVRFSHVGDNCSFDAFLEAFRLRDPALDALATIVRGADTGRLDLAPQAAGLAAISLGLSRTFRDDLQMLEHGVVVYDALHAWCRDGRDEVHTWQPAAYKAA